MRKNTQKKRCGEANTKAMPILRRLSEAEAFHFYIDIGKPTGEKAGNLSDFFEKMRSVKLESLVFHQQRKDFQSWVKGTLGDSKLARRIGRISPSYDDNFRSKICTTIGKRIDELDL